jgi:hypothetical protein
MPILPLVTLSRTIAHVLLTSSTSNDPSDGDYTVFFSNDNALLTQTQLQKRSANQQSKKKSKTSHKSSNADNMTSSPIMTQTTIQPTTPDKPSRVTRQSTAALTPSSTSSKPTLPPTKTTKCNSKSKDIKSILHQKHKGLIGRQFFKWFEGQEVTPGEYVKRGIFQATISEIHEYDKPLLVQGNKRSHSTNGDFMISFVNQLESATLIAIENDKECDVCGNKAKEEYSTNILWEKYHFCGEYCRYEREYYLRKSYREYEKRTKLQR